jgi:hypothetical protein
MTVVKLDARHRVRLRYPAELIEQRPDGVVLTAP